MKTSTKGPGRTIVVGKRSTASTGSKVFSTIGSRGDGLVRVMNRTTFESATKRAGSTLSKKPK